MCVASMNNLFQMLFTKGTEKANRSIPTRGPLCNHSHDPCVNAFFPIVKISSPIPPSTFHSSQRHRLFNFRNRLARIQPLWTRPTAVQNRMASVQAHAVIQHLFPLRFVLVAGIGQPAVWLQEHGGAEVFFAVPPVRGTRGRAAGAQYAFVEPVELLAVGGGLAVFEALWVGILAWGGIEGK